jgi:hypothetical protein
MHINVTGESAIAEDTADIALQEQRLDGAPSSTQDDDADTDVEKFKVFLSSRQACKMRKRWWHARLLPSFNEAASVNQKPAIPDRAARNVAASVISAATQSRKNPIDHMKARHEAETPTTTWLCRSVSIWNQAARTKRVHSSRDLERRTVCFSIELAASMATSTHLTVLPAPKSCVWMGSLPWDAGVNVIIVCCKHVSCISLSNQ